MAHDLVAAHAVPSATVCESTGHSQSSTGDLPRGAGGWRTYARHVVQQGALQQSWRPSEPRRGTSSSHPGARKSGREGGEMLRTLTARARDTRLLTEMDAHGEWPEWDMLAGSPWSQLGRYRCPGTQVPGTRQDQVPSAVLPGSTKTVPGATRYCPGSSGSTTSFI